MKYLIFTSRWICILLSLLVAFFILIVTVSVVFFKQQQGVQMSDGSLASVSYLPLFIIISIFAAISILFADDYDFGGEFLSLISAAISQLFLLYVCIHALGYDLLAIIAQHNYKGMGDSIPVLGGLARACPWWFLILGIVIFFTVEVLHTRLESISKAGLFILGPYLVLKIIQLF